MLKLSFLWPTAGLERFAGSTKAIPREATTNTTLLLPLVGGDFLLRSPALGFQRGLAQVSKLIKLQCLLWLGLAGHKLLKLT